VTNVTALELALIPAGTALVGVALATAGNAYLGDNLSGGVAVTVAVNQYLEPAAATTAEL
jgi:hypothetical protein